MKRQQIIFAAFCLFFVQAVLSQTEKEYRYVDFNHGSSTGNEEWVQCIKY